jgi:hypothetical protein
VLWLPLDQAKCALRTLRHFALNCVLHKHAVNARERRLGEAYRPIEPSVLFSSSAPDNRLAV